MFDIILFKIILNLIQVLTQTFSNIFTVVDYDQTNTYMDE